VRIPPLSFFFWFSFFFFFFFFFIFLLLFLKKRSMPFSSWVYYDYFYLGLGVFLLVFFFDWIIARLLFASPLHMFNPPYLFFSIVPFLLWGVQHTPPFGSEMQPLLFL